MPILGALVGAAIGAVIGALVAAVVNAFIPWGGDPGWGLAETLALLALIGCTVAGGFFGFKAVKGGTRR